MHTIISIDHILIKLCISTVSITTTECYTYRGYTLYDL